MKITKLMATVLMTGAVVLAVSACQKKEEATGPAETMGKQIDSAVKDAGEQANATADKAKEKAVEAGQAIDKAVGDMKADAKDLTQKAGEKMEAAGQKIQDGSKDAQK